IRDIIQNFSCLRAGINLSYLEDKDTHSLDELADLMQDKNIDVKFLVEDLAENWKE
ncbi:TPA: DUF262 domain-containing protein, partial [Escherichia coli]|nr:DUF262 domain-containing protein [Escherichia coli]